MTQSARVVRNIVPNREDTATRPRVDSVPTRLQRVVRREGDLLRVGGQSLPGSTLILEGFLQTFLLATAMFTVLLTGVGTAAGSVLLTAVGALATIGILALMAVVGGLHALWFVLGVQREFGPAGWRPRLVGVPLRAVSQVVLTGNVGSRLVVRSDRDTLFATDATWQGRWTFPHVYWLAHALATRMQVPLHVDLDVDGWQRWTDDAAYRARHSFDVRGMKSRAQYHSWYRLVVAEPTTLHYDDDGTIVMPAAMLERRGLRTPAFGIAWRDVLDAEVELYQKAWIDGNGSAREETRARLLILTPDRVRQALDKRATPSTVAGLLWVRDQVHVHAGTTLDHGTPADVPDALQAVRAR